MFDAPQLEEVAQEVEDTIVSRDLPGLGAGEVAGFPGRRRG
jgi:hypothetical protein